jgi:membrane fusion protein (multidrug efflux system)
VIGADNKASFRPVSLGDRVGNKWVVTKGLQAGEKVAAEGFQKVRDGMTVTVEPFTEVAVAEGR